MGGYGCRGTLPGRTINFGRIREDSMEFLENLDQKSENLPFLPKSQNPEVWQMLWGLFLIATVWTEKNSARWIRNAFPFFRLLPPHECMCDKFYWFSTRFRPTLTLQGLSKSAGLHPEAGPKWAKYGKHVANSYKFLENTTLQGKCARIQR